MIPGTGDAGIWAINKIQNPRPTADSISIVPTNTGTSGIDSGNYLSRLTGELFIIGTTVLFANGLPDRATVVECGEIVIH
jgi:hypothetical protein